MDGDLGGMCAASFGLSLLLIHAVGRESMLSALNLWVRSFSTPLAGLMFLIMAFCAAGSVSRERERSTLESLLTVPDGAVGVLRAKWLGGFLSARRLWWCLGAVWGWGLVTCGLNVLAVPLLLVAWAVLAGFVASLSLFCSVACRTTLRATVTSVVVLLLCGAGPCLVFKVGEPLLSDWLGPATKVGLVVFLRDGLILPVPLWTLAMSYNEVFDPATQSASLGKILAAEAGLACYALAGWVLWKLTVWRFLAEMGPRPRRG